MRTKTKRTAYVLVLAGILAGGVAEGLDIVPMYDTFNATEQGIINQAISEWEALFTCTEGHVVTLTFLCDNNLWQLPAGTLAETSPPIPDAAGRPLSATITIDNDQHSWRDSTVLPDPTMPDALDTLMHEIGHGLGWTTNLPRFSAKVQVDAGDRYYDYHQGGGFQEAAGDVDLVDDPNGGTHVADASDLMARYTPAFPFGRRHPTADHARILSDAYGYVIRHNRTNAIKSVDYDVDMLNRNRYHWSIESDGPFNDIHVRFAKPDDIDIGTYEGPGTASMVGNELVIESASNFTSTVHFSIKTKSGLFSSVSIEGQHQRVQLSIDGNMIPGAERFAALPSRPMTPGTSGFAPGDAVLTFGAGSFASEATVALCQAPLDPNDRTLIGSGTAAADGSLVVSLGRPLTGDVLYVGTEGTIDGFVPVSAGGWRELRGSGSIAWGEIDPVTGDSHWAGGDPEALHFPGPNDSVLIGADSVTVAEDRLVRRAIVEWGALRIAEGKGLHATESFISGGASVSLESGSVLGVGSGGGQLGHVTYGMDAIIVGNVTINGNLIPNASEGPMMFVEGSLNFGQNSFYQPALKGDWSSQVHVMGVANLDGQAMLKIEQVPPTYGYHTVTPLTAIEIEGEFDVPPPGTYLADPGCFWQGADYLAGVVEMTVLRTIPGDCDGDGGVGNDDFATVAANWRRLYGWQNGDFSGEGQIDNVDLAEVMARWGTTVDDYVGLPGAQAAVPLEQPLEAFPDRPDRADLIYDPQTGNVKLDPTEAPAGVIINFILRNAEGDVDFAAPGTAVFPWSTRPMPFIVDEPLEISESDQFMMGFSAICDLGNIFPPGMGLAELDDFLTRATYVGGFVDGRGTGLWDFDLIPEPAALSLLAVGALGVALRRRRR